MITLRELLDWLEKGEEDGVGWVEYTLHVSDLDQPIEELLAAKEAGIR